MSGGSDFLGRWSRRKRETEAGRAGEASDDAPELAEVVTPETGESAPLPVDAPADAPDDSLLAALPDLSEITAATDIRGFLQAGVPRALRNAALRKAWAADPAIAGYTDPARDYYWDWNAPDAVPGNSGRLLAENIRDMAERLSRPAPAPASVTPEESGAPEPEAPPAPPEPEPEPAAAPVQVATAPDAPESALPPPPRRHGSATPG